MGIIKKILFFLTVLPLMSVTHQPLKNTEGRDVDYCNLHGAVYVEQVQSFADYLVFVEDVENFADVVIFKEQARSFADRGGIWYFTDVRTYADFTIAYTDVKGFADFSVYYSQFKSVSGCQR